MQSIYDTMLEFLGLTGLLPTWVWYGVFILVGTALCSVIAALTPLVMVWVERKVSADIQDRLGPNRVGKFGVLQTIADTVKLLTKENITPTKADSFLHVMAPILVFAGAFLPLAAVPWARKIALADLNIGVLYMLGVASFAVIGIIMAGWSSNNKWSLLGAMRSAAQIVSYEIPNSLAVLTVLVIAGTLNMNGLAQAQAGGVHRWFIFQSPFIFVAFFIYLTSSLAEANRVPFDLPEAESELVSGYHTEYTGMRWALFMMSEYVEMLVVNCVAVTVFLGGWNGLLPGEPLMAGWQWFILKVAALMYVQVWLRFTLPRLRVDQLMYLGWKVLVPFAFVTMIGAAFQALMGPTAQTVMQVTAWALFAAFAYLVAKRFLATGHVPRRLEELRERGTT